MKINSIVFRLQTTKNIRLKTLVVDCKRLSPDYLKKIVFFCRGVGLLFPRFF